MKSKDGWSEDYEVKTQDTEMEINCLINKSRLMINFKTVREILRVYSQLMKVLGDQEQQKDGLITIRKQIVHDALMP